MKNVKKAAADKYPIEKRIAEWETEGVRRVKVALTDIDGVMRGKYLSLDKFASVVKDGGAFCDCVLGWDTDDKLYDNVKFFVSPIWPCLRLRASSTQRSLHRCPQPSSIGTAALIDLLAFK